MLVRDAALHVCAGAADTGAGDLSDVLHDSEDHMQQHMVSVIDVSWSSCATVVRVDHVEEPLVLPLGP